MGKARIVMVHGSWHWGGCFQKVSDLLGAAGYAVATPDLASHGYSDEAWDAVRDMAGYTAPVRALLATIDEPVILLGHSMGGVALSYLAETMPEKFKALIYLTAFMTPAGKTANDYIFSYADNPVAASLFKILKPVNDGAGLMLDLEDPLLVRDTFYGDCSEMDFQIALANATVTNTSVPNVYKPGSAPKMPVHYVTCSEDHAIPLDVQKRMIEDVPGSTVHSLSASHSPFFSRPQQVARLVRDVAHSL